MGQPIGPAAENVAAPAVILVHLTAEQAGREIRTGRMGHHTIGEQEEIPDLITVPAETAGMVQPKHLPRERTDGPELLVM
ncbi:MAG TPA: hypothetical protein ENN69_04225 [Spirochaetia bacterium]|nr:hypothetical protein [Spirochaetia bacterium]